MSKRVVLGWLLAVFGVLAVLAAGLLLVLSIGFGPYGFGGG